MRRQLRSPVAARHADGQDAVSPSRRSAECELLESSSLLDFPGIAGFPSPTSTTSNKLKRDADLANNSCLRGKVAYVQTTIRAGVLIMCARAQIEITTLAPVLVRRLSHAGNTEDRGEHKPELVWVITNGRNRNQARRKPFVRWSNMIHITLLGSSS
ncbi:MAG: hypothetical protein H6905_10065 [Hyphomicrobiales bacterium]|nr:hypothetical protein [Hyphomicrobiales bacterium]